MTHAVADLRSNAPEQLLHAADVIGRSAQRRTLFEAVYRGKKTTKTAEELAKATGLSLKQVLMAGKYLADHQIVRATRPKGGRTAYEKDPYYSSRKRAVLRLVDQPEKKARVPTKRNPAGAAVTRVVIPRARVSVKEITVDEIDSFRRVRKIPDGAPFIEMAEKTFKRGIERILGEQLQRADWGGEKNDVFSSRVRIKGKRTRAAFAFKGPGARGVLVPRKMGKNGDQLQRLFTSPADLYVVQYWNAIDESIYEDLRVRATAKSFIEGRPIVTCVIDGQDSARLISAYANSFET